MAVSHLLKVLYMSFGRQIFNHLFLLFSNKFSLFVDMQVNTLLAEVIVVDGLFGRRGQAD